VRETTDTLDAILSGPFQARVIVDALLDEDVTFPDLPVSDWELTGDIERDLPTAADLTVTYSGKDGTGLSPRGFLDVLAPYGQQVNVLLECSLRQYSETVQIGRFRIDSVPESSDSYFQFAGKTLVAGSQVQVGAVDLLLGVQKNGFRWPAPPAIPASSWAELQRLTGLPVSPSLDDRATPAGLIYQPKTGGRLEAVQQLSSWLGGVGVVNSFGEFTVVPFEPGDVVLELGRGKVVTPPQAISTDGLTNWVVGTYQEDDGTPIYAEDWVRTGPLRADGPLGPWITQAESDDSIKTQSAADARVTQLLQRSLATQTYRVEVSCRLNPLVENGDVVKVNTIDGRSIIGRTVNWKITRGKALMNLTLDVARDAPAA
jgi:hypothetical protein